MSPPGALPGDVRDLLDRWQRGIEAKDVASLATVFRDGPDLLVVWSNGERNRGWKEVRRHIEADFRQDVELRMEIDDPLWLPLGGDAGVLSHRYRITLTDGGESLSFRRLATMHVHRDATGWRVAALHVSTVPAGPAAA